MGDSNLIWEIFEIAGPLGLVGWLLFWISLVILVLCLIF